MKRVLAVFIVFIVGVVIIIYINNDFFNRKKLPVLSPCDVNQDLYDSSLYRKCIGHKISDFKLIDQLNRKVNIEDLKGKIIIADFFFVSCPGICLKMTKNLNEIHQNFKFDSSVLILSHTVWPELDSPKVLYNYAESYNVNHENWRFLTGDKKELYRLARTNYLVAPDVKDPNYKHGSSADFIHTENIVLVDRKQRIRGIYDGTDSVEMSTLLIDIKVLQKN